LRFIPVKNSMAGVLVILALFVPLYLIGIRMAARYTQNREKKILLGFLFGILLFIGGAAVLCGVAFAGCLVLVAASR